jgi:hypothetical protein
MCVIFFTHVEKGGGTRRLIQISRKEYRLSFITIVAKTKK